MSLENGEFKDVATLFGQLDHVNFGSPPVFLVSGADIAIADNLLLRLKRQIEQQQGDYETILFSAENGEILRLYEENCNIALFSPYRLLIVRQGAEVLAPLLSKGADQLRKSFQRDFAHLPDRLLLFLIYNGEPPAKLLHIFGKRLLHLKTRNLYPEQVGRAISNTVRRLRLKLSAEALEFMQEAVEPRQGAIEAILSQLVNLFGTERELGVNELRSLLSPIPGWNPFAIVDGLFSADISRVYHELERFNPPEDNFFVLFKLILNRTNEIRRATIGYSLGMSDEELLVFLNLKRRPPFIQKKILARLRGEIERFGRQEQESLYDFLIQLQQDFRRSTPVGQQPLLFQERISEIFFQRAPRH